MRRTHAMVIAATAVLGACSSNPDKRTLAQLRNIDADLQEVTVEQGLDKAMESYRRYLEHTPRTAMTPEAMRRLADLKVEKEFGILGDGKLIEMEAPSEASESQTVALAAASNVQSKASSAVGLRSVRTTHDVPEYAQRNAERVNDPLANPSRATPATGAGIADLAEGQDDFERRASGQQALVSAGSVAVAAPDTGQELSAEGPMEAIALYDRLLAEYPTYEHNDGVLYQKSRAYDELGRTEEAMQTMERLVVQYPGSRYIDEVQFRRAEYFFTRRKYREAESAYESIIALGPRSEYYELALYKLGWTLYKQEFYDEALHRYIALLDHKVAIGYDFDAAHEEADERRVADTFRVISLSFSNLGGTEIVGEFFAENGTRGYEDRIYSNLGEFYLTKLRYHDAAAAYKAFIELYPFHKTSPHFSMRVVDIYTQGGFQKLVLESKKDFAKTYGLKADYWRHFAPEESPDVLAYLKANLKDLANHYHAQYQQAQVAEERPANYREASLWYREFLASFPDDTESPAINYQLADLLLEEKSFGEAALEYERTAYDYAAHDKASAAGYAAIYAHREHLKTAGEQQQELIKRDTVASSLRFADSFPDHEHAPAVLGAAADDLYQMNDYSSAAAAAELLIERYPAAESSIVRAAWIVVAHSAFDLAEYPRAESAYARVLELMPEGDEERFSFVENLAAAIYKQGEQANERQDYRAAADHFLRIKQAAPTSKIRAAAEYDAGAALIRLEDWTAAAGVLEAFRRTHPEHELQRESTKQIAFVYRQSGQLSRAAEEYERIAAESDDPELKAEALLVAGDLHEQAQEAQRALTVYLRYVEEFQQPLEPAVETRFKIAEIFKSMRDERRYHDQLEQIVDLDAEAGEQRTARIKLLAARSALVLSERLYRDFAQLKLVQPFEASLMEKKKRMDAAIEAFGHLVSYEVGETTAAATFYIAEVYYAFNRALMESERPADLQATDIQDYELALEEEAFPFEEKAIEVHEKNVELVRVGIYNGWIDKSFAKLATLMPARYAKEELSSGFLGSIDRYAYRSPAAPASGSGAVESGETPHANVPGSEIAAAPNLTHPATENVTTAGVANAIDR